MLRQFRLTTANLDAMVDWYARMLGMTPRAPSPTPEGPPARSGLRAAWGSNDRANPRIAIISISGLADDRQSSPRDRPQHLRLECASLDDLLTAFARLKRWGIEPVLTEDSGATIALRYEDPDGNSVELAVEYFGTWEKPSDPSRTLTEFAARPHRRHVDPDAMIAALAAGMSVEEVHRRASAGEFPPSKPMGSTVLH